MNFPVISRWLAGAIGVVWCWIEPSMPFIYICLFAILLDCFTAWRCNRRIYKRFREQIKLNPKAKADGKLKSHHMSKMFEDFMVIAACVLFSYHIDNTILPHLGGIYLAQYVSAIFCLVQFVSILENESTCNEAPWARVLQKFIADKTERHLGIKLKDLITLNAEQDKECDSTNC